MSEPAAAVTEMGVQDRVALVAGATGLVGRELVRVLEESSEWKMVYGVARNADEVVGRGDGGGKYRFVGCDLLDRGETMEKLGGPLTKRVTHLFWVTWACQFQLETPESCDQNRAMLSNVLDAILSSSSSSSSSLRHVSLQTGTQHYVSLSDPSSLYSSSSSESEWCCPHYRYGEGSPRVAGALNFYYALEDLLKEKLRKAQGEGDGVVVGWSVHRPGLVLGVSRRSYFNVVGSLCVYGSICRRLGLPFLFGGDRRCWEEPYMDASDARLIAGQHIWWAEASSSSSSAAPDGQAFNAVNVTAFAWKEIWPALASRFGLHHEHDDAVFLSEGLRYSELMRERERVMGDVWEDIVSEAGLRRTRIDELANWSFLDAVFRLPGKTKLMVQRPTRAHRLGFTATYSAPEAILYWVDRMREERLIP